WIEDNVRADGSLSLSWHGSLNNLWTVRPLGACGDVDGMQPLGGVARLYCAGHEVHGVLWSDYRGANDANVADKVVVDAAGLAELGVIGGASAAIEVAMPERVAGLVCVEGVNAVVYCGDIEDVVLSSGDG